MPKGYPKTKNAKLYATKTAKRVRAPSNGAPSKLADMDALVEELSKQLVQTLIAEARRIAEQFVNQAVTDTLARLRSK